MSRARTRFADNLLEISRVSYFLFVKIYIIVIVQGKFYFEFYSQLARIARINKKLRFCHRPLSR